MELTFPRAQGERLPVALVTGVSRRQGIGAAITRSLAKAGVAVFFTGWRSFDASIETGIDADGPEAILESIVRDGGKASWMEADLTRTDALSGMFDEAERQLGRVSMLINNAAYSRNDGWAELTAATLDAHYQVNLRATALLTVEFARRWPSGLGGRVINLTSGPFKGPMLGEIAYAATKGAIEALTVTMAAELAARGITVNAVGPGPTDTGWMTAAIKEELLPKHPLGRLGTPDDIARLITFLCSEQADWITGQVIHTEGGFIRR